MYHRNYTTYLQKELDFLKLLIARFHEQEKVNGIELDFALSKMQEIYGQLLRMKIEPETEEKVEIGESWKKVFVPEKIVAQEKIDVPEKVIIPETEIEKQHLQND